MRSAVSLLLLGLVGSSCGPEVIGPSWPVDEFFEGAVGQSLGDNGLIQWFRIHDDRTWEYGVRGCADDPDTLIATGTWDFSKPDNVTEIELMLPPGEEFPGSLGAGSTKKLLLRYNGCEGAELVKVQDQDEVLSYSRGKACIHGCTSFGASPREIVWCDSPPTYCE